MRCLHSAIDHRLAFLFQGWSFVSAPREQFERDEQIVTDILVAVDEALAANGRVGLDAIDGPTVDDLRDAVQREIEPLEAEIERLREALRTAADDLDKAANQFEGMRQSQRAGGHPVVAQNPRIFAEKAARARSALEASSEPRP